MTHLRILPARLLGTLGDLLRNRRGNVLMIMAFSIIPLTFAVGMSIDYSRAARLQTRLNAAADAAALAAVTVPMMQKTDAEAKTAALNMFNAQSGGMVDIVGGSITVTATITGTSGANNTRSATVTWTAKSTNAFSGIVGIKTIDIGGTSTAEAQAAPNVDFYVMMDTSPSMLLPATSAGLSSMLAATGSSKTGACSFACHQTEKDTTKSNDLICDSKGKNCIDFYQVALNNNIVLRTDLMHQAVQNLTSVATTAAAANKATYRMGLSAFDWQFRQIWPTTANSGYFVDGSLTNVNNHVTDATILIYCKNNTRVCDDPATTTKDETVNDNDTATDYTTALTGIMGKMPTKAGFGTKAPGDTPQAILFLITDGMRDESNSGRKLGPIPKTQCDAIKARSIRIAILYTEYLPAAASDSWSITNVRTPYLSPTDKISPALIDCASTGLYYKVTTDDDISAALAALFQKAVSTAHITS